MEKDGGEVTWAFEGSEAGLVADETERPTAQGANNPRVQGEGARAECREAFTEGHVREMLWRDV